METNEKENRKYPTVYRTGGCGSKWIATYQFLDTEEAEQYISKFDDERIIRWVKYRPQKITFTNGKGWRESGLPSSEALMKYIG